MAALPYWSWLLAGIIITFISWHAEMPLFFWIGIAFIAFGIARTIIVHTTKGKKTTTPHKTAHPTTTSRETHPAHKYYRCTCGNPVRTTDNFCSNCGRKLR